MSFLTIASGPVERAKHLLPQLATPKVAAHPQVVLGLRRILLGVFKKIVIADSLATLVTLVYRQPEDFSGAALMLATVLYAFQLYADFSGYTDMVLGLGQLFGLALFENFRQPYFAVSILDFWKRWHISLTDWIRDFMFFPLTRYLLGKKLPIPNLGIQAFVYLTVMSVVGLWHGFTVNFLIWGGLHGLYMTAEALLPANFKALLEQPRWQPARVATTFVLVCFAWIWFRAPSFNVGWYIVTHLWPGGDLARDWQTLVGAGLGGGVLAVGVLLALDGLERARRFGERLTTAPWLARWAVYYALVVPVFLKLFSDSIVSDFVYFRF
jgi:D-alanyl-lipoteichoic acid acyltransferase DltB (MBOAT superfamily)